MSSSSETVGCKRDYRYHIGTIHEFIPVAPNPPSEHIFSVKEPTKMTVRPEVHKQPRPRKTVFNDTPYKTPQQFKDGKKMGVRKNPVKQTVIGIYY